MLAPVGVALGSLFVSGQLAHASPLRVARDWNLSSAAGDWPAAPPPQMRQDIPWNARDCSPPSLLRGRSEGGDLQDTPLLSLHKSPPHWALILWDKVASGPDGNELDSLDGEVAAPSKVMVGQVPKVGHEGLAPSADMLFPPHHTAPPPAGLEQEHQSLQQSKPEIHGHARPPSAKPTPSASVPDTQESKPQPPAAPRPSGEHSGQPVPPKVHPQRPGGPESGSHQDKPQAAKPAAPAGPPKKPEQDHEEVKKPALVHGPPSAGPPGGTPQPKSKAEFEMLLHKLTTPEPGETSVDWKSSSQYFHPPMHAPPSGKPSSEAEAEHRQMVAVIESILQNGVPQGLPGSHGVMPVEAGKSGGGT